MDVRILGALEVSDGGRPLALGGTKQRAVLAVLLLHANEVVSRARLIDEVFDAVAAPLQPTSARAARSAIAVIERLLIVRPFLRLAGGCARPLKPGRRTLKKR